MNVVLFQLYFEQVLVQTGRFVDENNWLVSLVCGRRIALCSFRYLSLWATHNRLL